MVFQQNLLEKVYFIAKMSGLTMVRPFVFHLCIILYNFYVCNILLNLYVILLLLCYYFYVVSVRYIYIYIAMFGFNVILVNV